MDIKTFIKKAKKLGLRLGFMKFMGYEAIFSCAFKPAGSQEWVCLPHSSDYWYADPLIIKKDGRQVVFMERVNRRTGIGAIVASDITGGSWTEEVSVIEEAFHMSFPMCFEWNGELYMIPESEMDNALNLYRCTEFPYRWEHAARFPETGKVVDTVAGSVTEDRVDLIGSEYKPEDDFYTRFKRFSLIKDREGRISVTAPELCTEEYTLHSRMAGYPIFLSPSEKRGEYAPTPDSGLITQVRAGKKEEELHSVWPVQRSTSGVYGYSVMFMADDPDKGRILYELTPRTIKGMPRAGRLIGVHTYSATPEFEVTDIQYLAKKITGVN